MTDFYEALDKQTFQLRAQYLMARYAKRDFVEAAGLLFTRNMAAGEGFIDDMPEFKITSNKVQSRCNAMEQARQYCVKWEPLVEKAVTVSRADNLMKISRRL